MLKRFRETFQLIKYNYKPLLLFEILYRMLGVLIIFPLGNMLLNIAVSLSGYEFIINATLLDFLRKPTTILLGVILLLLFGIYITFEIIVLSILFHASQYKKHVSLQALLIVSIKKTWSEFKKYHLFILFSSIIFLLTVEGFHLVGIASTFELPNIISYELQTRIWVFPIVLLLLLFLVVLFIETIFFELQCTIEDTTVTENMRHSRTILRDKRWFVLLEFVILNLCINIIVYLLYIVIVWLLGQFVQWFGSEQVVFSYIITFFYTAYIIIGFIATIFLIPINFAWINVLYYKHKTTQDLEVLESLQYTMRHRPLKRIVFQRMLLFSTLFLGISTIYVASEINERDSHLALFRNPDIIVHRGGGNIGPENSLCAIEQGIEQGGDAVEIDVRFTQDDVPVLLHDESIKRTTIASSDFLIQQLHSTELVSYPLLNDFTSICTDEPIPTLQQAFSVIDNRTSVYLDIKAMTLDQVPILIDIIEESGIEQDVYILSFSETILANIKQENPSIQTVLLLSSFLADVQTLANSSVFDHYGFRYEVLVNDKAYIRTLAQSGKGIFVWTVNDDNHIREVNTLGVKGIITDHPIIAREIVYGDTTKDSYEKVLESLFERH